MDWHGGFTAAAGHALYTARSFPKEYWNRAAFVCEPTGHLVHINWLVPSGSGFIARDGYNMLASDDEWTSPIMAEVGPDGALWVIDWYNFIVQHNPTPAGFKTGKGNAYETPLRDKTHGRIYRIVYTGAKTEPKLNLDRADVKQLIQALHHDNLFWRQTAQRLLLERRPEGLAEMLANEVRQKPDTLAAVHCLWTLHGLGEPGASAPGVEAEGRKPSGRTGGLAPFRFIWKGTLEAALKSKLPEVRRAALGVLPRTAEGSALVLSSDLLRDDQPLVRRDALLALAEMPGSAESARAIASVLNETRNAIDRWLPLAATSAAAASGIDYLDALAQLKVSAESEKALIESARVVSGHLARSGPASSAPRLLTILNAAPPVLAEAMLTGLAARWPADARPAPEALPEEAVNTLMARLPRSGVLQLTALLRTWGYKGKLEALTATLAKGMRERLTDAKQTTEVRLVAARDLVGLAGEEAVGVILEQITPQSDPALVRGLLDALGQSTAASAGTALVQRWSELSPAARQISLGVLLRRAAWTRELLTALEKGTIDRGDLNFEAVQLLSKHPVKEVAERAVKVFSAGGRLPSPDRQKVLETLLPLAQKQGDPERGKKVFETNCAKCHRFGSMGNTVGPDLTGVAVRERKEILVDILDPNRSVEGNYRQYGIETRKGTLLTGLLVAETRTAVELLDSEAKKHVVLREDIETMTASKLSLMPEGFEKLPQDDLTGLLAFLTARQRYLPLPLSKAATITSVRGMFNTKDSDVERLIFPKWGPLTFEGVPFQLLDPRDGTLPNVILLHSPNGAVCREMPRTATVPCNTPARAIHLLGGVAGWASPGGQKGSVSLIVRLHYADKKTEDHPLRNGIQIADYIRVVDVPGSKLAFQLRGQQIRYLKIEPGRTEKIESIEFVKGPDRTAPIVAAVTVETGE